MVPLIAITTGEIIDHAYPWSPMVYGKAHTYTDSIIHAGGAPLLLPLSENEDVLRRIYDSCHAILLTGGNDLSPNNYDQEPSKSTRDISPRRDRIESLLIEWALEDDKPILGICRGVHIINVVRGGDLYQDIKTDLPHAENHDISRQVEDFNHIAHRLKVKPDTKLSQILGVDEIDTNSLHHQAVNKLGDGVVASAHSGDGVIEAIEMPHKTFVIAIQSHPEALEDKPDLLWNKLFETFVEVASRFKLP